MAGEEGLVGGQGPWGQQARRENWAVYPGQAGPSKVQRNRAVKRAFALHMTIPDSISGFPVVPYGILIFSRSDP